jgi:hypothetical protein
MAQGVRAESGVRRLVQTPGFVTVICLGLFSQTKTAVPGMSQFTDAEFGYSFWYPSAWKVVDEPVSDPTRQVWFPDARIIKELQIRNAASSDHSDQLAGVIVQELLAPNGLTELGRSKSPSPVRVDGRYFFDSETRRWMHSTLSELPDGTPPGTPPAEISRRTIGGLPIFWGAVRGGAEVIVPLDKSHFLAISPFEDPINHDSHIYLAATVVATDPRAGQRARDPQQAQAVRREAVKLGIVGESLGYWYKDGEHVYDSTGGVIHGADPKTFAATGGGTAKDAHHTYDWRSGSLKIGSVRAAE